MKKEEFVALGIDEKMAEKAAAESKKELDGAYVPKDRFNEVNESRKQLETTVKDYEGQLETLKASAGDNEALKVQIAELQEQNKKKDEEHQEELKNIKLTNAIKLILAESAQDSDLVASLINKEQLILGEDGKVTGLEEQIKTLKQEKAFLFKEEKKEPEKSLPGFVVGAKSQQQKTLEPGDNVNMKDAIAAKIQAQTEQ